jgi:ATP-dependent RNA helicase DeaD
MLKEEEFNDEYNYINSIDVAAAFLQMSLYTSASNPHDQDLEDETDKTGAQPGMVRLFMNIGKSNRVVAKDIIESIVANTNLEFSQVGKINIFEKFTFVEVPKEFSTEVVMCMKKSTVKGKRINIEKANRKNVES